MSYVVNIAGHKDTADAEESKAFEEEQLEAMRELVEGLAGVTTASFAGGTLGRIDLLAAKGDGQDAQRARDASESP